MGGNIRSKVEYNYTTGTPASVVKSFNFTYGDSNWKDKLTSYDGKEITYDQIGNPLSYNGNNNTWTYHGYDISVNTGKNYTYSFDALISIDANIANTCNHRIYYI